MGTEIYMAVITALVGVIGFFLARSFSDLSGKAEKTDLEDLRSEVEQLRNSMADIKENYLTKEDFFREQLKTEKKLDKIMDILMEIQKKGA